MPEKNINKMRLHHWRTRARGSRVATALLDAYLMDFAPRWMLDWILREDSAMIFWDACNVLTRAFCISCNSAVILEAPIRPRCWVVSGWIRRALAFILEITLLALAEASCWRRCTDCFIDFESFSGVFAINSFAASVAADTGERTFGAYKSVYK